MRRVIVVEDEYYVRASIIARVDWAAQGLSVPAEAENGQQALDILEHEPADIAIVDVSMPVMNGLEFIAFARRLYPGMQFIVLTGYSEFAFARDAVRLQVVDYLLKPVDVPELCGALQRAIAQLSGQWTGVPDGREQERLRYDMLVRWIQHPTGSMKDAQFLSGCRMFLALMYAPAPIDAAGVEASGHGGEFLVVASPIEDRPGVVGVLMYGEHLTSALASAFARGLLAEGACRAAIACNAGTNALTISLSDPCDGPERMDGLFTPTMDGLEYLILLRPEERFLQAREAPPELSRPEKQRLAVIMRSFDDAARSQDRTGAGEILTELFSTQWSSAQAIRIILQSLLVTAQKYALCHVAVDNELMAILSDGRAALRFGSLAGLREAVVNRTLCFLFEPGEARSDGVLEQVQQHIEAHLDRDLRVDGLARQYYIGASYLSQICKRRTGLTLSDYIEGRRIERAKALLMKRGRNVALVAQQVGYPDPAHFSRVFKRMTGITPKKFQQTHSV